MKTQQQQITNKHVGLIINEYHWFSHYRGVHAFQKQQSDGKFCEIECTEEQLHNGDIEFMTLHGLTISKDRKRRTEQKYLITQP